MLEFCAHPLRHFWLMYVYKAKLVKDIEFRGIKDFSGFTGSTSDYKVKINFSLGMTIQFIKQTNFEMYIHYTVQLHCRLHNNNQISDSIGRGHQ